MSVGLVLLLVGLLWLATSINNGLASRRDDARGWSVVLLPALLVVLATVLNQSEKSPSIPAWEGSLVVLVAALIALPLAIRVQRDRRRRLAAMRRVESWDGLVAVGRLRGQVSRLLAASQAEVFALLANPAQAPRWRGVEEVRALPSDPPRAGSTWVQMALQANGKTAARSYRMLIWEPPARCAWQAEGDRKAGVWTLECVPSGVAGTLVTLGQTYEPSWLYAAVGVVAPVQLKAQIEAQLARYLDEAAGLFAPATVANP